MIVLAQDEVDKKGLSQKDVADNNQGIFFSFFLISNRGLNLMLRIVDRTTETVEYLVEFHLHLD